MKQLTIRISNPELERRVEELRRVQGLSLNQAVLQLLHRGAGLVPDGAIGDALDGFFGTWTEVEATQIEEATRVFEAIDEELWR